MSGRVFLADFGLARDCRTGSRLTRTGTTLGTPAYMSPELARGDRSDALTPASDVWALGCVLAECATGRPVFAGDTPAAVIGAVLTGPVPALSELPGDVRRLIHATLTRTVAARPASARALGDDCRRLLHGERPRHGPPRRRNRIVVGLVVGAAIVGAAATWSWTRPDRPPLSVPPASEAVLAADAAWNTWITEPAHAEALLDAALAADPGLHRAHLRRGVVRWALRRPTEAIADWASVPDDAPEAAWAHLYRALVVLLDEESDPSARTAVLPHLRRAAADAGDAGRLARAALVLTGPDPLPPDVGLTGVAGWEAAYLRALHATRTATDPAVAVAAFTEGLATGVTLPVAYFERGRLHEAAHRLTEALTDFDAVCRLRPDSTRALQRRADMREATGDLDGARADLDAIVERGAATATVLANRALLRKRCGDTDGALQDYDRAIALEADAPGPRLGRAQLYHAAGRLADARADLDAVLAHHPRDAEALGRRAGVRQELGDLDGAASDYEAALAIDDQASNTWGNLARLRYAQGLAAQAHVAVDRAIALDADAVDLLALRAAIRAEQGDIAGALADYGRALSHDGQNPPALRGRANLRIATGDLAGAHTDLDTGLAVAPADVTLRLQRAMLALRTDDLDSAVADCDAALAAAPTHADAFAIRGFVRMQRQERAAAIADLQAALRHAPANWRMERITRASLAQLGAPAVPAGD